RGVWRVQVGSPPAQSPFNGPHNIPGLTQVEDFDNGGEGVAYHDASPLNDWGQYWPAEAVDIVATADAGGGYEIGNAVATEWLEYSVNVATAGTYNVEVRVASNGLGGTFHIEFNGVDKTGAMNVPNTGGWGIYQTITKTGVSLSAGQQILRIALDTSGPSGATGNFNWFNFVAASNNLPPVVSITSPANGANFTAPASIVINASASDSDGSITKVEFYQGTTLLNTDVASPYTFTWSNVAAGSYTLTAKAYDNASPAAVTTSSPINVTVSGGSTQTPFLGSPFQIPTTIQVEDFDNGGEGVAYHDLSPNNDWGQYRPFEAVDIVATADTGGGYEIGNALGSEWLEYTVNVATAGTYNVDARVASNGQGGTFHIEFNGVDKTGVMSVPNTGGWSVYQTITKTGVSLSAGQQILRIALDTSGPSGATANFNWIRITSGSSNQPPAVSITSPANGASYNAPASIVINATASDSDGSITKVEFYQGTTLLNTDLASPYTFTWSNVAAGSYMLTAKAYDNASPAAVTTSTQINITVVNGSPFTITLQSEDFDSGGQNVAYFDLTLGNDFGAYRIAEDVDIFSPVSDAGGGYGVGNAWTGEWLKYTFNIPTAGTYTIEVRVASDGPGGTFHIEFNVVDRTGARTAPNTGGWDTWQTILITGVTLNAGQQVMRLSLDTNGGQFYPAIANFNYIRLTRTGP